MELRLLPLLTFKDLRIMANWASTSYRIEGNQKDLQELYNLCKAFMDKERPVMEEGASENWEGNIILALGEEIGDSYIRGFIQNLELSDGLLSIEAEEAWGATDFNKLLEKHYDGMKVYFIVEEEMCEVYATNDAEGKYFNCRSLLTSYVDGEYHREEFKNKNEALKYAAKLLGRDSVTILEVGKWNMEHEDNNEYININGVNLVD